jgi:HK97 family phage portal protein
MVIERIKQFFAPKREEVKKKENLGQIIAPVWQEIPPETKAGDYISEGLRGWAYIAISSIADEISSSQFNLYRKVKKNWEEIEAHPAIALLEKPNSIQTKDEFFWLTAVYLLSEGECPWVLDRPKNPTSMAIMHPEKLTPIFDEKNLISKYKYQLSNGQSKDIKADEIVFLKLPSVATPFRGAGVMSYIAQTLDLDNYTEEYLRLFFFNAAVPTGVLESDQELNSDIVKRIRSQFESRHKGVKNAHKLAILEKGLKFNKTAFTMQELQMGDMDSKIRDKVLAAFKIPKSVIGIIDDVNRANGENADRVFARRAVKPKMSFIEAQINQFFLPKFSGGEQYWFEFENPVKEDELLKAQVRQLNITAGIRTANEYREEDGLEPLEEPEETEELKKEDEEEEKKEEKKDIFFSLAKEMLEPKKEWSEQELWTYHDQKITNSDQIENEYQEKLQNYFVRQGNRVLAQLNGKRKKDNVSIDFEEEEAKELATLTQPYLTLSIEKQSALTFALLGIEDAITPNTSDVVKAWILDKAGQLGEAVQATTKEAVKNIIQNWVEKEESISVLKSTLKDYFGNASRAETIARTEVSRASGYATVQTYKSLGIVGKKWLTARDERVCEFCSAMDGKIAPTEESFFGIGDSFTGEKGGQIKFDYEAIKAYPLHARCRCDLIPVFASELVKEAVTNDRDRIRNEVSKKEVELEKREKELEEAVKELEKTQML